MPTSENTTVVCSECRSRKSVTYRWGEEKDCKEVLRLLGGLPKAGTRENISNFLLAETNGVIVGCMGFEIHCGRDALLRSLKVKGAFRRQYMARTLFSRILNKLRRKGISRIYALTLREKTKGLMNYFGAQLVAMKEVKAALDPSQPSEFFDDKLDKKCKAWQIDI